MAITIFTGLCILGEGFLVYVLVQFVREGRRGATARRLSSLYPYLPAEDSRAYVPRRKVIQITVPEGYEGDTQTGKRAS